MNEQVNAASLGALLLRVTLGLLALAHGFVLKVMTFGLDGFAGYMGSLGYPAVLAYLVVFAEVAGGLALVLGILPRLAAIGLIPVLIGATLQHVGNGWMFANAGGGWEFPVAWTVLLLASALIGPGALALGRNLPGKLANL